MIMRCFSPRTAFCTVKLTVVTFSSRPKQSKVSVNLRVFPQYQTLYTDRVEWGSLFPFMHHFLAKIIEDFCLATRHAVLPDNKITNKSFSL